MNILDLVVGKPIKTSDERAEQIGPAQGVLSGAPTGKSFNESVRNFESQREKEFTLHVCAQSPKRQEPERKA